MVTGLEDSVARVLGGADPNTPAGTAFLFAKHPDRQLWMTCHHVIRKLPSIALAIHTSNDLRIVDCEYRGDFSSPVHDIAVLQTTIAAGDQSLPNLHPLPFGAPLSASNYRDANLVGCGIMEKAKDYPRGVNFSGTFSVYQCISHPADAAQESREIAAKGNPWNIPFNSIRQEHMYEFLDSGNRLEPGFSGSPICIEAESVSGTHMCIGMLDARRTKNGVSTHGFVIPCEVISSTCPQTLPFHAYAECVIVVLAAKINELEELCCNDGHPILSRLPHYDADSRDAWKPFTLNDPTVKEMMLDASTPQSPSWQLSSDYLDRVDEEFEDYLVDRSSGPLVYVIDPCSTDLKKIREMAKLVADHNRGACYLFPLCDTLASPLRQNLKEKLREYLGSRLWKPTHSTRLRYTGDINDFRNRVHECVKQAWEQFIRENHELPRRRPDGYMRTLTSPGRMEWAG